MSVYMVANDLRYSTLRFTSPVALFLVLTLHILRHRGCQASPCCLYRLLRYPLLYHPHYKIRPKQGLIKDYLGLILGWGWYRRGYFRIP